MSKRTFLLPLLLLASASTSVTVSAQPGLPYFGPLLPAYLCAWDGGGPQYERILFGANSWDDANRTALAHMQSIGVPASKFVMCMSGNTMAPPYSR